jgi:hypothetical protein
VTGKTFQREESADVEGRIERNILAALKGAGF